LSYYIFISLTDFNQAAQESAKKLNSNYSSRESTILRASEIIAVSTKGFSPLFATSEQQIEKGNTLSFSHTIT
jgi:hypothetical protein